MEQVDIRNVLVIGIDAAALAISAKKAGYNVYGVDYFGDQDLKKACRRSLSIIKQKPRRSCGRLETDFSPSKLLYLAKKIHSAHRIDATLLASGLEDSPQVLAALDDLIPIIGNSPETILRVRDKVGFFSELKRLSIPHPKTALARDVEEARRIAKDIGYPLVMKPLMSLGGVGIRKVEEKDEIEKSFMKVAASSEGVLIQEFILGTDASIAFLSSRKAATVLTLNEQLLGKRELGQKEPFGYCGNIVPITADSTLMDECVNIVRKITSYFNLAGSNGIDIVISQDNRPHVVEVNPRFQGSLECVESVLRMNLVDAHMKACQEGTLPPFRRPTDCCVRLILYARQRSTVPDLSRLGEIRDIPLPWVVIEEGEPLCSLVVKGKERGSTLREANTLADDLYCIVEQSINDELTQFSSKL